MLSLSIELMDPFVLGFESSSGCSSLIIELGVGVVSGAGDLLRIDGERRSLVFDEHGVRRRVLP